MFRCPNCKSTHFGTTGKSEIVDGKQAYIVKHRSCHDEFQIGCNWRGQDNECLMDIVVRYHNSNWLVYNNIEELLFSSPDKNELEKYLDNYENTIKLPTI